MRKSSEVLWQFPDLVCVCLFYVNSLSHEISTLLTKFQLQTGNENSPCCNIFFPFLWPQSAFILLPLVPPLIGTILRLLQFRTESKPDGSGEDEQLQTLAEITAEFLSDICLLISKVFLNSPISVGVDNSGLSYSGLSNSGGCLLNMFVCLFQMMQETVADSLKNGYLTEKMSLTAAASLVPNFNTSVSTNTQTNGSFQPDV